jgi:hypothetical protein
MINAWSLLYDELYGDDEMTEDIKITTGTGNTIFNVPEDVVIEDIPEVVTAGEASDDVLTIDGGDTINFDDAPLAFNTFADNDDSISHHIEVPTGDFVNFDLGVGNTDYADTLHLNLGSYSDPFVSGEDVITFGGEDDFIMPPTPGIQKDCTRKYKEDESIKALQDYISTTYGGHYTSDNNNVQTLDLIESVGDAESFCRSNAIKYLSRYDKKGQAKRDILKALHYSLLLYHFSGQLNETTTRGYETF